MALSTLLNNEANFLCPICFELPKEKVFQCRQGHPLCSSCHLNWNFCPNCGALFDKAEPIRNLFFEGQLDNIIKVDCAYKLNGCDIQPTRNSVYAHQSKCYFNFEKFGKLINICKIVKYKDCEFRLNNGNCEDAVKHFMSVHGCPTSKAEHFQMELTSFQEATEDSSSDCFWTPVISDLNTCFLITIAIFNGKLGSLTCVSYIMPKFEASSEALVMECSFSVATEKNETFKWGFMQSCFNLNKMESLLPNNLFYVVLPQKLNFHFTKNGSLLINCMVRGSKGKSETSGKELERFVCSKRIALSHVEQEVGPVSKDEDRKMRTKTNLAKGQCSEKIANAASHSKKGLNGVSKAASDTEIRVKNLPGKPDLKAIENAFKQFGEVNSLRILKVTTLTNLIKNKDDVLVSSCMLKFADAASVEKVLKSKEPIFMKHNGKRHRLEVEVASVQTSAMSMDPVTGLLDNPENVCMMSRDNLMECVRGVFSMPMNSRLGRSTETMSFMAAKYGNLECMKFCVGKGIDVNLVQWENNKNISLLGATLSDKDCKIGLDKAKLLVRKGADVQFKNCEGDSLLHLSVLWGSAEAVKFFLDKGLDVNGCNEKGWTPLHLGLLIFPNVQFLSEKVKLLFDRGADAEIKDKKGRSAFRLAEESQFTEQINETFQLAFNGPDDTDTEES